MDDKKKKTIKTINRSFSKQIQLTCPLCWNLMVPV